MQEVPSTLGFTLLMAPSHVGGASPSLTLACGDLPLRGCNGGVSDIFPVVNGSLEDTEWGDI